MQLVTLGQALHECGIAHGDIKCENALVYNTYDSTAENWQAKLSDFGNARVGLNTGADRLLEMSYSLPYNPPELPDGRGKIFSSLVEKAEIWGWGMLLWYVMIDGKLLHGNYWKCESQFYDESHRREIDVKHMSELKETDGLSSVASDSCEAYLSYTHAPTEITLARGISALLKSTLVKESSKRPTILESLQQLNELRDGPRRSFKGASPGSVVQSGRTLVATPELKPLADMPFFDYTQHHEIRGLDAVHTRILKELERATNSNHKGTRLQAHLQLSLCYAAGINVSADHRIAVDHLWIAASGGLDGAQALILRIHRALGVEIPQESVNLFRSSAERPSVLESIIATSDMLRLDPQAYEMAAKVRARYFDGMTLLQACKIGDLVAAEGFILQDREIHEYGASGETALHWLGLLPCEHAQKLVGLLVGAKLDPSRATTYQTQISEHHHFLRMIPAGTTALHWALETDNEPVFRILLESLRQKRSFPDMASLLCTAAQCQSSGCLIYLCQKLREEGKSVDIFDHRGFSALYYAICSDPIEQILRFVPDAGRTRLQPIFKSYKERHLVVIRSLLNDSVAMSVSPYGFFNVVHLAAALDSPDLLDLVEQHQSLKNGYRPTRQELPSGNVEQSGTYELSGLLGHSPAPKMSSLKALVNEHDYMGMAPMNAAIAQRALSTFRWLLKHGANPNFVNSNFSGHAIHLCGMHDDPIPFANELLEIDPRCLNLRSAWGFTPLHHAAFYGHTALAKLLIEKGADLSAHSGGRATWLGNVTPLGAAISSRSFPMVKFMCKKLRERRRPLHAHAWYYTRKDALQYLLRPGRHFQASDHAFDASITPWDRGCYDHPFSKASKKIFDHLLDEQPECHVSMGQRMDSWLRHSLTIGAFQMDPIHWAVRMTNMYAIEKLDKQYKGDYRDLLAVAYRQLLAGSTHVARSEEIASMIERLRAKQLNHHEQWLQRHNPENHHNPLSRSCVTYMRKYVTMEQRQYEKALDWMSEHPLTSRPAMLEYRDADQWVPGYRARFALIWVLLTPTIVSLVIIALDPSAQSAVSNIIATVFMIILSNMNVLWLKLIRIATIFYNRSRTRYPAIDPRLTVIQMSLSVVAMALSILNIWIVYFGSDVLIRYSLFDFIGYEDDDQLSTPSVLPQTQTALSVFYNTTSCLIAYIVVTQLLFQIYVIIFLQNRWAAFGMGPDFDPRRSPYVDNWAGNFGLTARYGITFRSFARPFDPTHARFYTQNLEQRQFCF